MIREVLIWPNPALMQPSSPVGREEFDDGSLLSLVGDLKDTMEAFDGAGLAAPQIGFHKRVVILARPALVLVNPKFLRLEGAQDTEEGCLSVPGLRGRVARYALVEVEYQDFLTAAVVTAQYDGLAAIAIQHECDHLDGKVFVDYLGRTRKDIARRKMLKIGTDRYRPEHRKLA